VIGAGQELNDDNFVKGRDEGEGGPRKNARQDKRQHDSEERDERLGARN
jgi:hypothetical protein